MRSADEVFCTWSYRAKLPDWLQIAFSDLDDFLRRLIISAETSITICAPYLSVSGLQLLTRPLIACGDKLVRVRMVTQCSGENGIANRRALKALFSDLEGSPLFHRLRILSTEEQDLVHAKLVIADGKKGYLGSANLSVRGLERNLEFGVALSVGQARALDQMVDHLESTFVLTEVPLAFRA